MLKKRSVMIDEKELARLVAGAKNNDSTSLAGLFGYLYPKIYTFCFYRVSSEEDAKDLTGEILLKIMKALKKQKGSFLGWVYRIASNHIIDYYRRKSRRSKVEVHHHPDSSVFLSKEADIDDMIRRDQLKIALAQLPEEQRMVTLLKFIQGYKNEEVAEILEKTVGAVKALQFRALRSLKIMMEEDRK